MSSAPEAPIFDVTPGRFDEEVVARSHEVPVLVDFWAAWCGPCRALGPVLEALAREAGGDFVLAKVDTEAHPEVAARFSIRSIPQVTLFRGGAAVGSFVGALPRSQVKRFLDEHLPNALDAEIEAAAARLAAGDREGAKRTLAGVVEAAPAHPKARLLLARIAVAEGDRAGALAQAAAVDPVAPEAEVIAALVELVGLGEACRAAGGEARLAERLAAAPGDHEARYLLGGCAAIAGRHREALEQWLEVLESTRRPPRQEAHRAMLALFRVHGRGDDLVDTFQRRLQVVL